MERMMVGSALWDERGDIFIDVVWVLIKVADLSALRNKFALPEAPAWLSQLNIQLGIRS